MISFLKGIVASIGENFIILETNEVGFMIYMPTSSLLRLNEGMAVTVHTHMSVSENDISLYGFLSREENNMFKKLITVSGIGPRAALSILSSISVDELKMAIASGDSKLISKSKGVGLKTAQKIVIELKGKFEKEVLSDSTANCEKGDNLDTAISFVEATGISRSQCLKAVSKVQIGPETGVDEIIDIIFKNLSV